MLWRNIGNKFYLYSYVNWELDGSGKLHATAALSPEKKLPFPKRWAGYYEEKKKPFPLPEFKQNFFCRQACSLVNIQLSNLRSFLQ
jgi:hypothetical protein